MNSVFRLLIGYVFVRLPSPHPTVSKCLAWGRNLITLGSFVCLFSEIAINYTINILHYYDIFDSFLIFCVLCYSLWFLKVGNRFKNQSGSNQQQYNGLIYRIQQMLFISVLDMICVSLIVVLAPLKLERVPQIAKPTLLYLYIYILAQTNEEGDARPKTKSNSSGKAINSSS
ncbi:hypothetical protein BKA69DRAFT_1081239 [Paraphysoderma sedebokerense]|nr:hypothetical protein BKA69DRAFT_1081239 [Paraphysoderma sedebokerense]